MVAWLHCNTLQHAATRCNTLQHAATRCNMLQHAAARCSTLWHIATQYNTLQHPAFAEQLHQWQRKGGIELIYTAQHVDTLRRIATRCSTLHLRRNYMSGKDGQDTVV